MSHALRKPKPSFATAEEVDTLRAELADLRRQLLDLRALAPGTPARPAIIELQARYAALSPEAKALHEEAEAEARAFLDRGRRDA
jgi:hypothetical protein